jgi:RNA polymerase sigma-70 factor (ECF subfamily)
VRDFRACRPDGTARRLWKKASSFCAPFAAAGSSYAQEVGSVPTEPEAATADAHDRELVARTLAGDRAAFEALVRRHERRVYRVAMALLGNPEDAADALQDCFLQAYRHLDQFRGAARFSTWLVRIAVNAALQQRRDRDGAASLDELMAAGEFMPARLHPWHPSPEQLYGRQELRRLVEQAVAALPEPYRAVLVLRDLEGLSAEETAAALGLTVPAVKSRLHRARLVLREYLAAHLERPAGLRARLLRAAAGLRDRVARRVLATMGRKP